MSSFIKLYRFFLGLIALFILVARKPILNIEGITYEPFWASLLLSFGFGSVLFFSFKPFKKFKRNYSATLVSVAFTFLWLNFLLFINNLHPKFIVIYFIGQLLFALSFRKYLDFFIFSIGNLLVTLIVVSAVLNPIPPKFYVFSIFIIFYLAGLLIGYRFFYLNKQKEDISSFFNNMLDTMAESYYLLNNDFEIVKFNKNAEGFFKDFTKSEIKEGMYFPDLVGYEDKNFVLEVLYDALKGNSNSFVRTYNFSEKVINRQITVKPIYNDMDEVKFINMTSHDVSKLKQTEKKYQETEKTLESITNNISDAIYRSTEKKGIVYCNESFYKTFGYNKTEIQELDLEKLYADKANRKTLINILQNAGRVKNFEVELVKKDGSTFWATINARTEKSSSGELFFDGAVRDITREKFFKAQLIKTERVLEAINQANIILLRENDSAIAIPQVFEKVGNTLSVDRIYFFENFIKDGEIWSKQIYEWCSKPELSEFNNPLMFNGFAFNQVGLNRWLNILKEGKIIASKVAELPIVEQQILIPQNIKSILVAPLIVDENFYGMIGFDDCHNERDWSFTLQNILKSLASSISASIKKELATQTLLDAKLKAEEMNQLKTGFVAKATHEIRTPLNGIIGLAELIKNEKNLPIEVHTYIDIITDNAFKLLNSISSILDFSRSEISSEKLNPTVVNVSSEIEKMMKIFKVLADKKNLSIKFSGTKECEIFIDPTIFNQILNNVVGNALKYTEKGEVSIYVEQEFNNINIMVQDTGIGISEGFKPLVFQPFERGTTTDTKNSTGLGLFIVKRYVELFNGKITFQSQLNKGTIFYLSFPAHQAI